MVQPASRVLLRPQIQLILEAHALQIKTFTGPLGSGNLRDAGSFGHGAGLGHADPGLVLRVYGHATKDSDRDAAERIQEALEESG